MPRSIFGKRVHYQIHEYPKLLDSCNMHMTDWAHIAEDIAKYYSAYDAFIVIHGTGSNPHSGDLHHNKTHHNKTHHNSFSPPLTCTDTMAYTASALSFMLENLGKTVILTGSQVPLAEARNDAVDNLLGALTIVGHFIIPEVCLYFLNTICLPRQFPSLSASLSYSVESFSGGAAPSWQQNHQAVCRGL